MVPGARLIIIGKQGAGKGTQCVRLSHHFVVPHISTGEIFRAASRSNSELGNKAREYMEAGELVPDDIVLAVVAERLAQDDTRARGFILDGFPRTAEQAEGLSEMLAPDDIDLAIDLEVPTEVVLRRLATRRVCSDCGANYGPTRPPAVDSICDLCGGEVLHRTDDTEAAIRRRLAVYEAQTAPLVEWYAKRDQLVKVDGLGHPDAVMARILTEVEPRLARR